MKPSRMLCFRCMRELPSEGALCPHCEYNNQTRHNGSGLLTETVLAEQYQVGLLLGQGTFGATYIGYDLNLHRPVAIKEYFPSPLVTRSANNSVLSPNPGCEEIFRQGCERALRESRMAANVGQIDGVASVYNAFTANNTVYIVMEYVKGQTLRQYVESHGKQLTLPEALQLLTPVVSALSRLHRAAVLHRNVKPDNIMIRSEDQTGVLLDFGVAAIADADANGYAPSEQHELSFMDGRTDQYALAATLLYALTDRHPRQGIAPSLSSLNPSVNAAAEQTILKGMAQKISNRYPDIDVFWAALNSAAIVKTNPLPTTGKKPAALIAAAAALLALIGALACFVAPAIRETIAAVPPAPAPTATATATPLPAPCRTEDFVLNPTEGGYAVAEYIGSSREVVIPAEVNGHPVVGIQERAFKHCNNLISIILPKSISTIGESAFMSCENLSSITLPENLTTIGESAFMFCKNLSSITLPENLTTIGESAFMFCKNLSSITLPENLTAIDNYVFHCCSLTDITIPRSVVSIGDDAFSHCNIADLVIPEGVVSIGDDAFSYCNMDDLVIPEGVVSIGKRAFYGCGDLTNITIPESVSFIGDGAFGGIAPSAEITVSPSNAIITIKGDVLFDKRQNKLLWYPQQSFYASYRIPMGTVSIGDYAFDGCNNLTDIIIPEGVISIGNEAFNNCDRLTRIIIPEGVISIGNEAFNNCDRLTDITIPEGVISIGNEAFNNCDSLTRITIPEGVISIGNNAFFSCDRLSVVILPESVSFIGQDAFSNCPKLTLSLPAGSYAEDYARTHLLRYITPNPSRPSG